MIPSPQSSDSSFGKKQKPLNIVVAGASGYIGQALLPQLREALPNACITALSRSRLDSEDPNLEWKPCDLFSLKSVENALPDQVDLAIYLVHSMGPTAALDQGSFADYDLILADNFARGLKNRSLNQIIYLGGLIPVGTVLSKHLQSRLEVEETFFYHGLPTTVLRAGLIVGERGSSFQILLKLVHRLPLMICPRWTQMLTSPVPLSGVLNAFRIVRENPSYKNRILDLSACEPITYLDMMKVTARALGKRRFFVGVSYFTPTLSRLWVSLVTNSPKTLVYPLIESLKHKMIPRNDHKLDVGPPNQTYENMLELVNTDVVPARSIFRFHPRRKSVRSVQRLPLPPSRNATWVKDQYLTWLPRFLGPLITVAVEGEFVRFMAFRTSLVLLELRHSPERSTPDRQLLYIKRGLLVSKNNQGRLEFRSVLNHQYVLAAIHDYEPKLPWYVYTFTQAKLHLWVMNAFRQHLENHCKMSPESKA